jgi:hypothetical protein
LIAVLAAAPGLVALAFQLWPDLKPDPREHLGASLKTLAIDPSVPFGEYLKRIRVSRGGFERDELRTPGTVVYLRVVIRGHKRQKLTLRDSVYRARTRQRIAGLSDAKTVGFKPEAPSDESVQQVFIPPVGVPDKVFVRFELSDRNSLLAFADTPAFRDKNR